MASKQEVIEFFHRVFPGSGVEIEDVGNGSARMSKTVQASDVRPGDIIYGPVLMELADVIVFVAIQGEIGIVTMAVTTSLNMNFLRPAPSDRDLVVECRLIKLGRSLAVGDVMIYSEGKDEPVAQATVTYALPASS